MSNIKRIPDFENYAKRLRKFVQYKDLPENEFEEVANTLYQKKYGQKLRNVEFSENEVGVWLDETEANQAKEIFDNYIKDRNISNVSDLALLKQIVYYEIQILRIQVSINERAKEAIEKQKIYVPKEELRSINEINEQVLDLKKVLGLSDDKKGADPLEELNKFKRKCIRWAQEHLSRFRKCPSCGEKLLLLIRPEIWDVYKHPFFRDSYLFNEHGWDLYKEGKITSLDLAKILIDKDTDNDYYIGWLEKKLNPQKEIESGDSSAE